MSNFRGRCGDTVDVPLLAATATFTGASGRQLIIAELSGTCDITIYGSNRQAIGSATGVRAGYDLWIPDGFAAVLITAGTAQTAKLIVSDEPVRYNRLSGSVEAVIAASTTLTAGKVIVGAGATTIAAVAGQQRILVRADLANTAAVTMGTVAGTGVFLMAGEWDLIATADAVDLISTAAGQVIHYRQES